jgi:excisionase family DNA binding protein
MVRLLNKTEVAELLHVSVRSVDRLRESGALRAVRVRGRVRFRSEDVAGYVERAAAEGSR